MNSNTCTRTTTGSTATRTPLPIIAIDNLRAVIRPDQLREENQPEVGLQVGGPDLFFDLDENDPLFQQAEFRDNPNSSRGNITATTATTGTATTASATTNHQEGSDTDDHEVAAANHPSNNSISSNKKNNKNMQQQQQQHRSAADECAVVSSPATSNVSTPSPIVPTGTTTAASDAMKRTHEEDENDAMSLCELERKLLTDLDHRITAGEERDFLQHLNRSIIAAEEKLYCRHLKVQIQNQESRDRARITAGGGISTDEANIDSAEPRRRRPETLQTSVATAKPSSQVASRKRPLERQSSAVGVAAPAADSSSCSKRLCVNDSSYAISSGSSTRPTTAAAEVVRITRKIPKFPPGESVAFIDKWRFSRFVDGFIDKLRESSEEADRRVVEEQVFSASLKKVKGQPRFWKTVVKGPEPTVTKFMKEFGIAFENDFDYHRLATRGTEIEIVVDGSSKLGGHLTQEGNYGSDDQRIRIALASPDGQLARIVGSHALSSGAVVAGLDGQDCRTIADFKKRVKGRRSYHLLLCVSPDADLSGLDMSRLARKPHRRDSATPSTRNSDKEREPTVYKAMQRFGENGQDRIIEIVVDGWRKLGAYLKEVGKGQDKHIVVSPASQDGQLAKLVGKDVLSRGAVLLGLDNIRCNTMDEFKQRVKGKSSEFYRLQLCVGPDAYHTVLDMQRSSCKEPRFRDTTSAQSTNKETNGNALRRFSNSSGRAAHHETAWNHSTSKETSGNTVPTRRFSNSSGRSPQHDVASTHSTNKENGNVLLSRRFSKNSDSGRAPACSKSNVSEKRGNPMPSQHQRLSRQPATSLYSTLDEALMKGRIGDLVEHLLHRDTAAKLGDKALQELKQQVRDEHEREPIPDFPKKVIALKVAIQARHIAEKVKHLEAAAREKTYDSKILESHRNYVIDAVKQVTDWIKRFNDENESTKLNTSLKGDLTLLEAAVMLQDRQTLERVLGAGPDLWKQSDTAPAVSRAKKLAEEARQKIERGISTSLNMKRKAKMEMFIQFIENRKGSQTSVG